MRKTLAFRFAWLLLLTAYAPFGMCESINELGLEVEQRGDGVYLVGLTDDPLVTQTPTFRMGLTLGVLGQVEQYKGAKIVWVDGRKPKTIDGIRKVLDGSARKKAGLQFLLPNGGVISMFFARLDYFRRLSARLVNADAVAGQRAHARKYHREPCTKSTIKGATCVKALGIELSEAGGKLTVARAYGSILEDGAVLHKVGYEPVSTVKDVIKALGPPSAADAEIKVYQRGREDSIPLRRLDRQEYLALADKARSRWERAIAEGQFVNLPDKMWPAEGDFHGISDGHFRAEEDPHDFLGGAIAENYFTLKYERCPRSFSEAPHIVTRTRVERFVDGYGNVKSEHVVGTRTLYIDQRFAGEYEALRAYLKETRSKALSEHGIFGALSVKKSLSEFGDQQEIRDEADWFLKSQGCSGPMTAQFEENLLRRMKGRKSIQEEALGPRMYWAYWINRCVHVCY